MMMLFSLTPLMVLLAFIMLLCMLLSCALLLSLSINVLLGLPVRLCVCMRVFMLILMLHVCGRGCCVLYVVVYGYSNDVVVCVDDVVFGVRYVYVGVRVVIDCVDCDGVAVAVYDINAVVAML